MDPQIIDFYNELPQGVNVIDKINEEFNELQKKYNELEDKVNQFKAPYIIVETIEKYKKYDDIISNQFRIKIKDFLEDKEMGLFAIVNNSNGIDCNTIYDKYNNGTRLAGTCREKIINELNNITNNKNKEWCECRVWTAFESCLKKYSNLEFSPNRRSPILELMIPVAMNEDDIIENLIHHIFNEDDDFLPEIYRETSCVFLPSIEELSSLICYHCKGCRKLDNFFIGELICFDCYSDAHPSGLESTASLIARLWCVAPPRTPFRPDCTLPPGYY